MIRVRPMAMICFLVLMCSAAAGADNPPSAHFSEDTIKKLDAEIDNRLQKKNLPGVVVSIIVPGEGTYVAAKGKANLETGRPREVGDPFRIASITKTFIATAILQLIDQGKLQATDALSKWFPSLPNAKNITVRDLLRMRSGIADPVDKELMKDYYHHSWF